MFQPFLRFYQQMAAIRDGGDAISAFQPFLRFNGARVVPSFTITIMARQLFQPFLRFNAWSERQSEELFVSTLLEIQQRYNPKTRRSEVTMFQPFLRFN